MFLSRWKLFRFFFFCQEYYGRIGSYADVAVIFLWEINKYSMHQKKEMEWMRKKMDEWGKHWSRAGADDGGDLRQCTYYEEEASLHKSPLTQFCYSILQTYI